MMLLLGLEVVQKPCKPLPRNGDSNGAEQGQ